MYHNIIVYRYRKTQPLITLLMIGRQTVLATCCHFRCYRIEYTFHEIHPSSICVLIDAGNLTHYLMIHYLMLTFCVKSFQNKNDNLYFAFGKF